MTESFNMNSGSSRAGGLTGMESVSHKRIEM